MNAATESRSTDSHFLLPHDQEIIAALTCSYFSPSVLFPIFRVKFGGHDMAHMDHAENARTTGNWKSHGMDLQHPFSFLSRYQISLIATANKHYPFARHQQPQKIKRGCFSIYILCINKFRKRGSRDVHLPNI